MNEQEKSDQKLIRGYKRLYFIMIYLVPLVYILMLGMLQYSVALPYNDENYFYLLSTNLSFMILIFGILSSLAIVLTYKFLIPLIQKCEDSSILTLNMTLIAAGPAVIDILGILIGMFGYANYEIIDWFTVIPFIIIGSIYGIYLHKKVILLSIKKYEIIAK